MSTPCAEASTSCPTSVRRCAAPSRRNCRRTVWRASSRNWSNSTRNASTIDRKNTSRVCHGVEICRQAGVPYSSLRTGMAKQRDFRIVKIALNTDREQLFDRINKRVDRMIEAGLEQEARSVYHLRHLNSLNTVGMKEMFALFDGTMDRDTAIQRIKKNTRVYAKKQLTWYRRDPEITWVTPAAACATALDLLSE